MESPVFVAGDRELAKLMKDLRDLQHQAAAPASAAACGNNAGSPSVDSPKHAHPGVSLALDAKTAEEVTRKGEKLVRRCLRTLKSRGQDQLAVTTCIWLLCRLVEIEEAASVLGRAMVDAGLPGQLVELLRSPHLGGWAREHAAALSSQLCSIACSTLNDGASSSSGLVFPRNQSGSNEGGGNNFWGSGAGLDGGGGDGDFGVFDLSMPLDVLGFDATTGSSGSNRAATTSASYATYNGYGNSDSPGRMSGVADGSSKAFLPYQLSAGNYNSMRNLQMPASPTSAFAASMGEQQQQRQGIGSKTNVQWAQGDHVETSQDEDERLEQQLRPGSVDSLLVDRLRRTLVETKQVDGPTTSSSAKGAAGASSSSSKCLDAVMASPYAAARAISMREMMRGGQQQTQQPGDGDFDGGASLDGTHPNNKNKIIGEAFSRSLPPPTSNSAGGGSAKALFSQSVVPQSSSSSSRFPALVPRGNNNSKAAGSSVSNTSQQQAYSNFTYDPSTVYADMTADLARLDPLCLNLSIRIHDGAEAEVGANANVRARASSASSMSRGTRSGAGGSLTTRNRSVSFLSASTRRRDAQAKSSSSSSDPSSPGKVAPLMSLEHLVDTTFMRNLFADGTTMEEAQVLILKMEEVFKMFDAECTGVLTWEVFTKLLLSLVPERVLRGDVLDFISAQAENPNSLVDYREFCSSGKVLVIGYRDTDNVNKLSTMGWIARQQSVTGDPSTYTWKHHVEWFRDRKATSLIWLLRRASRAILSVGRRQLATNYLLFQGERVRCLSYLMNQGKKALGAAEIARKASLQLQKRAVHARRWATNLHETQRFLKQVASNIIENELMAIRRREIQARRAAGEYLESDNNEFEQDPLVVEMQYREACRSVYNRVFELQYKQRIAQAFLKSRGVAGLKLFHEQTAASKWLKTLGGKLRDRYAHLDRAAEFLTGIGVKAIDQWKVHDRTRAVLVKFAIEAKEKYKKYIFAQQGLYRIATLALRREADLAALVELGQRSLEECNEKDRRLRYKNKQDDAVRYLQDIPRRIFARERYFQETKVFLKKLGEKALRLQLSYEKNAAFLKALGSKAVRVIQRQRQARADLFTLGERARLKAFESTWMSRPTNKDVIKTETSRVQRGEADVAIIRREWAVSDRLRGELEDAFSYYSLKRLSEAGMRARVGNRLHAYVEEEEIPIDDWVISRLDFRILMCDGRLLQCAFFQPDEVFASLDSEACGYVSFRDLWRWLSERISANAAEITRVWTSTGRSRRMTVRNVSPPRPGAASSKGNSSATSSSSGGGGGGFVEALRQIALGCSSRSGGVEDVDDTAVVGGGGAGAGSAAAAQAASLNRAGALSLEGIVTLEDRVLLSLFHRLGARNLDA